MDERGHPEEGEVTPLPLDAIPGVARLAAGAWYRGATWGVETTLRASRRIGEAAVSGASAVDLIEDVRDETLAGLKRALAAIDPDAAAGDPREEESVDAVRARRRRTTERKAQSLQERGAALLERAAEVGQGDDPIHPGFDRIVDQLAPDEARILKLLVNEGPQAIIYVNRAAPLGIGAREVARRISLVGREAGCLRPELVPAYLDNLVRLGLVAIRRDPVPDEQAYQVIEAQPEVLEVMSSESGRIFRAQSSHRSIHVTDFGRTFCQVCFPAEHLTGEMDAVETAREAAPAPPEGDPADPARTAD
jgi:hypothetical protein